MIISFEPLARTLDKLDISVSRLKHEQILSGGTYTRIAKALKGEVSDRISIGTIRDLCEYLNCDIGEIIEITPERKDEQREEE